MITTSATLSVNDDMGWFQRRVQSRLGPTIVQQIHSPFDYPEQVLVYAPRIPVCVRSTRVRQQRPMPIG